MSTPSSGTSPRGRSKNCARRSGTHQTMHSRLLLAVGVGRPARSSAERRSSTRSRRSRASSMIEGVAEVALVLYGAQVLQEYVDVLEERGLEPPQRWAGSRAAVAFARDLGFGTEYGGFENRSLRARSSNSMARRTSGRSTTTKRSSSRRSATYFAGGRPSRTPLAPDGSREDPRHDRGVDRRHGGRGTVLTDPVGRPDRRAVRAGRGDLERVLAGERPTAAD